MYIFPIPKHVDTTDSFLIYFLIPFIHQLLSNTSEVFAHTQAKPNCSSLLVCVMLPYVLISLPSEPATVIVLVVVTVRSSDGSSTSLSHVPGRSEETGPYPESRPGSPP